MRTIFSGKWHLAPETQAVDAFADYPAVTAAVEASGFDVVASAYVSNMDNRASSSFSHNPEWMVSTTAAALTAAEGAGQPWFLYYAPTAPHSPSVLESLDDALFPSTETPAGTRARPFPGTLFIPWWSSAMTAPSMVITSDQRAFPID